MSLKPHISAALQRIQPSATLAMTARVTKLKADGVDVIGLSAGEPDFDTPDFVKEAAIEAIRNGQTKYTLVDGTVALKDAIRGKFRRDNGLDYGLDQITVNVGGKHTLFNALVATVDPGPEVASRRRFDGAVRRGREAHEAGSSPSGATGRPCSPSWWVGSASPTTRPAWKTACVTSWRAWSSIRL